MRTVTGTGYFRLSVVRASGLLLLLSCLLVSACTWLGGRTRDLEAAHEQWTASRPIAYSMTLTVRCGSCFWKTRQTTVQVDRPTMADSQEALRPEDVTVDVLFYALEQALDNHPERYRVSYDDELGYPVSIDIDMDSSREDDEYVFDLLDFTPIDTGTG
jgi:hypothetical protein